MTKAAKAKELFAANPDMANRDFVKLLMSELSMTINGARTYAHNLRNKLDTTGTKGGRKAKAPKVAKAPSERQLNKRLKLEKAQAKVEFGSKSVDEIAKIKEANLARMKAVSAKLRPFRDQLDDVIKERSPGFDPELARLEIREDELGVIASQGLGSRPQMFD